MSPSSSSGKRAATCSSEGTIFATVSLLSAFQDAPTFPYLNFRSDILLLLLLSTDTSLSPMTTRGLSNIRGVLSHARTSFLPETWELLERSLISFLPRCPCRILGTKPVGLLNLLHLTISFAFLLAFLGSSPSPFTSLAFS